MAELSARTLQEMEAGRRAVYRNMAETRREDGMEVLRKMFKDLRIVCLVDPVVYVQDGAGGLIWPQLTITCRVLAPTPLAVRITNPTLFEHTEPVESFPSDFLIAQLALISQ